MWTRTRLSGLFASVRAAMPLVLEISVTLASLRMAALLLSDQTYFDRYPASYGWLVEHFPSHEWYYGTIAALAATLKLVGMLCLIPHRSQAFLDGAFFLRQLGWGLSVVFWGGLCLVLTRWDISSLGAILSCAMAMFSTAGMLMGPAMPEETHGYEG